MYTIGKLANAAGTNTPTIRYYEEIGLLPPADRTASGQRAYGAEDLERVVFIRRCRDLGFSIDQVRLLAGLSISADKDCREVGDIARLHLHEVKAKLADLHALEEQLLGFVTQCDTVCRGGTGRDCVVFEGLRQPEM